MRILSRWIVGSGIGLAMLASTAPAQERASNPDQQAIELAAARAVVSIRTLAGWALDPRLYVRGVIQFGPDGSLRPIEPNVAPRAETVSSHSWEHLAALVRALGIEAVVDDAQTCVVVQPDLCRLGQYRGTVAFGPAWIKGEKAEINVDFWQRVSRPNKAELSTPRLVGATVIVRLERKESTWQVVGVTHIQL
jgi:hypothetical protein